MDVVLLSPSQRLISDGLDLPVTPFKVDLRFKDSVDALNEAREKRLILLPRCPTLVLEMELFLSPPTSERRFVDGRGLPVLLEGVFPAVDGQVIVAALRNR